MHHAFPRDCPYPHLSGTVDPLTPDEWLKETGETGLASEEDIKLTVDQAQNATQVFEADPLPWVHEEELLVHRSPPAKKTFTWILRSGMMFLALVAFAYSIVQSIFTGTKGWRGTKCEKHQV